jgi:hypothetical protein
MSQLSKITQDEKDLANRSLTISRLISSKRKFHINESRCVANVDYEPETQVLTIEFQQRGTYVYRDVPLDVFVDFADSGSQGRYFNLYIREKYSYERVS